MNQEVKTQWLTALRSGEYAQGKGYLRQGDEFCCLGVLCDLAVKAGVTGEENDGTGEKGYYRYGSGDSFSVYYLPSPVMDWAGIESQNPHIPGKDNLGNLNDEGSTFEQIADLIDQHL